MFKRNPLPSNISSWRPCAQGESLAVCQSQVLAVQAAMGPLSMVPLAKAARRRFHWGLLSQPHGCQVLLEHYPRGGSTKPGTASSQWLFHVPAEASRASRQEAACIFLLQSL